MMGLAVGMRRCGTRFTDSAPAPNPDPKRWELVDFRAFARSHVLVVKYLDATNFDGVKVMVYDRPYPGSWNLKHLDPHFDEAGIGPVARFRPDERGIKMACELAEKLSRGGV